MPNFVINAMVHNNGAATVSAHVGASLVCAKTGVEYYNIADDIKKDFPVGATHVTRYLNTELGPAGKYDFYLALWEGGKVIGTGIKYAVVVISGAVEKKKKIAVNIALTSPSIVPASFVGV